ncbi:MAG: hypothetical protein RQ723_09685 [Desulfuromonadales bacterium]|nr:hypothetical protein [Desulfuromonadales bacterium]
MKKSKLPTGGHLAEMKSVGDEVVDCLVANGIETVEQLARVSQKRLLNIDCLPGELVPKIQTEAKRLVEEHKRRDASLRKLVQDVAKLKKDVGGLVEHIRERYADNEETSAETRRALRKEIGLTLASLDLVETNLSEQMQLFCKGLSKADARLAAVSDRDVEQILAGLKKARKKIDQMID